MGLGKYKYEFEQWKILGMSGRKVRVRCSQCGREIWKYRSRIVGKRIFCNRECYTKYGKPWVSKRNKREDVRKIMSESRKGKIPWNKGKSIPKHCGFQKGHPFYLGAEKGWFRKGQKQSEEIWKKIYKARKTTPNKKERILIGLINDNSFPYKFVGDGKIIIDGKCPDFIQCNGKKKIIELFGNYWHDKNDEQIRKDIFSNYGYKTLVIWEDELKDLNKVITKIKKFEEIKI